MDHLQWTFPHTDQSKTLNNTACNLKKQQQHKTFLHSYLHMQGTVLCYMSHSIWWRERKMLPSSLVHTFVNSHENHQLWQRKGVNQVPCKIKQQTLLATNLVFDVTYKISYTSIFINSWNFLMTQYQETDYSINTLDQV